VRVCHGLVGRVKSVLTLGGFGLNNQKQGQQS
jgi:hypothetical protein